MHQRIKVKIIQLLGNPNVRVVILGILALIAALMGIGSDHGGG